MLTPDGTIKPWKDMTPDERVADSLRHLPTILARWRGGRARLWSYSVSHCSLTIRVERAGVLGNLHIDCSAEHIQGPVAWENAQIEISVDEEGRYRIEDRAAGFRVVGYCLALTENVKPVYEGL
jgi:hypothetical protein